MIARINRFHGLGSVRPVYKYGRTVRSAHLSTKFLVNKHRTTWRCAVVVSRKVSKSAVTRNRIRRRLYAIMEVLSPQITEPADIVITVYHEQINDISPKQLENLIQEQLAQAHLVGRPQSQNHGIVEGSKE